MSLKDLCVAIPLGGVVHEGYLEHNLRLLRQTDCLIYVGMDCEESLLSLGNYEKVKKLAATYADRVVEFPSESYYRPGGIWKKIFECWKLSGASYVRALGYDDYLPPELLYLQHSLTSGPDQYDATCCNQLIVDERDGTASFSNINLNGIRKVRAIGRNPFSFICWEARANFLVCADFERMLNHASAAFEYLLHAYLLKGHVGHVNSPRNASAVRREHPYTISHFAEQGIITECDQKSVAIRSKTGYSMEQALTDWRSLNFPEFVHDVRKQLSPMQAWLFRLEDRIRGVSYPL